MRKIILSMMVSVDGYIESSNPNDQWFVWDEEMARYMLGFFNTVDTFIYGRRSYEVMIDYWPKATGEFADIMNKTPKLIFSGTLQNVTWNSTLIRNNVKEEMLKRRHEEGKDMVLFAGATLASTFIKYDLIDEYRLIVNPVVLGSG